MAPNVPAEIDVFTVPHSRMKELVNIYATKVQDVDYRNCQEVGTLLKELQLTLHEFKYHESIENMFIMDQLKNRLKQRHIYNSAVCDCHNDNRINQMMTLVKNGKHLWKTSVGERLSYGHELQKAFIEFVQKFLPHMEEEENIFQPLLVEHFEYDELCVLKELVLEQHELIKDPLYQEKAELDDMPETDIAIKEFRDLEDNAFSLTGLYGTLPEYCESKYCDILPETETHGQSFDKNIVSNLVDDKEEIEDIISCKGIPSLPSEILIKIFSYLMPPDRGRCAQVCSIWNELVYSKPLWKIIYPIQWARGIWNLEDMNLNHAFQEEMSKKQLPCIKQDEDADIDESDNDSLDPISQMENDFFVRWMT